MTRKKVEMETLNLQPQTSHNHAILGGWGADKRSESDWELSQIPKEGWWWDSEFNLEKQWEFAGAASHLARRSLASCALVMPRLVQHPQSSSKPHQKQRAGAVQSGHPLEVAAVSCHCRALPLRQETCYHWDLPALCNGRDPLATVPCGPGAFASQGKILAEGRSSGGVVLLASLCFPGCVQISSPYFQPQSYSWP